MAVTRQEALKIAADIQARGFVLSGRRLAVLRDPGEEKTKGGIYIPDTAVGKPLSGTLVMIGTGFDVTEDNTIGDWVPNKDKPEELAGMRLGDWITFSKYDGVHHILRTGDGWDVQVEVMHANDIYIYWRGE